MRLRGFVPLDELIPPPVDATAAEPPTVPPSILGDPPEGWETRSSLFGEADG